ncbi:MAG: erythromycin biosynthesis sensory transduction protein eryC1 [Labilithrix sp.]|nr:erythromycin biosynthesis sensory transduction protein eryC1 [Labilithrix sp.]
MIPCANPTAQYLSAKADIDAAVAAVLARGWYVLGDEVRAFEAEFASWVGVGHGVGVGSGTDAVALGLRALGVGPGDEVVTVSHTAVATVAAIEMTGASAVLVDIDPATYVMDVTKLEAALGPKTKAIVAVHLYGHPVDLEAVAALAAAKGIPVLEDCAQAHGASLGGRRVGSMGTLAAFSFYPTKNLGAMGDGGMVVTGDAALAARVRELREYGWRERYVSAVTGVNSRLDELQAAILRVKLRKLDADNDARRAVAARYVKGLAATGLVLPVERPGARHVYHLFVVRAPGRRDELQAKAKAQGVGTLIHYPVPIHLQPAYRGRLRGADRLPETERAAREVLSLPMFPELPHADVDTVIRVLENEA